MNNFNLKNIRIQNGNLSQSELARRLGVGLRTIQKYEKTGIIPEYMQKLIQYEFFSGSELPEKESAIEESSNLITILQHYEEVISKPDFAMMMTEIEVLYKYKQAYEAAKEAYRPKGIFSVTKTEK